MISFDSNVLVYAVDRDAGDRHEQAVDLIERAVQANNCIQPLQTLGEFYTVATRKVGLEQIIAQGFVEGWQAVIPVEPATNDDLAHAMRAVRQHGLSFWDAMLWATVRRIGARALLSEDFQDGREIEGIHIANPFLAHNQRFIDTQLPR